MIHLLGDGNNLGCYDRGRSSSNRVTTENHAATLPRLLPSGYQETYKVDSDSVIGIGVPLPRFWKLWKTTTISHVSLGATLTRVVMLCTVVLLALVVCTYVVLRRKLPCSTVCCIGESSLRPQHHPDDPQCWDRTLRSFLYRVVVSPGGQCSSTKRKDSVCVHVR